MLVVVDHPLIKHKLAILRSRETSTKKFREIVSEITLLLTYEATRDLPLQERQVETPLCTATCHTLANVDVVVTPIMRAGLGMVGGMLAIFPLGRVAHIGLKRDEETAKPITYYYNVPSDLSESIVVVVDPMLATAGSLSAAIDLIKKSRPARIIALCLIAAPEGKARIEADHPDVAVYVAAMDERLNERAFIVPGLGDAGDRMFGTL